jgi:hypothetical protein
MKQVLDLSHRAGQNLFGADENGALHHVRAATAEFYGEHLVLLDSQGKLAALFLMETVESWNEINDFCPRSP